MNEQQQEEQMPSWVQQNSLCRVMWEQSKAWQEQARETSGDDMERQRKLTRLARHACGGSEGQACES